MKLAIATMCFAFAVALLISPLPRFSIKSRLRISKLFLTRRARAKLSFEDELQFVFNLKSQLNAGVNQTDALEFALGRSPEFAFVNTRQAQVLKASLLPALRKDAIEINSAALVSCANLLEISSNSGSSIYDALTQVGQALMNRRALEQLISTELASTKATVFVLAGLPVMGLGMGLILGADSISWLLGTAAGRVCLLFGLGLEVVGWRWIKRLLNRALADVT